MAKHPELNIADVPEKWNLPVDRSNPTIKVRSLDNELRYVHLTWEQSNNTSFVFPYDEELLFNPLGSIVAKRSNEFDPSYVYFPSDIELEFNIQHEDRYYVVTFSDERYHCLGEAVYNSRGLEEIILPSIFLSHTSEEDTVDISSPYMKVKSIDRGGLKTFEIEDEEEKIPVEFEKRPGGASCDVTLENGQEFSIDCRVEGDRVILEEAYHWSEDESIVKVLDVPIEGRFSLVRAVGLAPFSEKTLRKYGALWPDLAKIAGNPRLKFRGSVARMLKENPLLGRGAGN
jgi:hypothetical protein